MSRTTVVTGAWGARRQFYIDTFLAAFDRFWPVEIGVVIYTDGPAVLPVLIRGRSVIVRSLHADCRGYTAFIGRHENQLLHTGCEARRGWKSSEIRAGYSFRFDAVKFAGQAFAPADAIRPLPDDDILVWLDADVASFAPVPDALIERLLAGHDGAYLGRLGKHSEIGFWAIRLRPETRLMVRTFVDLYTTDTLFDLGQWHSAFAWDFARDATPEADMLNLTPRGEGHVWFQSPLKQWTDHRKGKRKDLGYSPEGRR